MFDKMKQLMEFKGQAERIKRELDRETLEVKDVSGVRVVITGSQVFESIDIDDELFRQENKDKLKEDLCKSINAAIKESQKLAAAKMSSVMPGIPGL